MQDLSCVIHLHSTHSDGTGTVPQIARAAVRNDLDVVLLTDHDTLAAQEAGEEGWHGDVLVLVGHEVSPRQGNHLLAFGLDRRVRHRDRTAAEVCRVVRDAGGVSFAAHPFSRGSERFKRARGMPFDALDCEYLDGVELWNLITDTGERLAGLREALRFIAAPRSVIEGPPVENLRRWDELCRARPTAAIGGLDAHQVGIRIGPVVPLRLMSYRRSFALLHTHVLADSALTGDLDQDRDLVLEPLRAGRSYLSLDWVAPATGFGFWAEGSAGRTEMGSQTDAGGVTLRAHAPASARWCVVKDGAPVGESEGTGIELPAEGPGVYRVEARRDHRRRERSWIVSNPIYLR